MEFRTISSCPSASKPKDSWIIYLFIKIPIKEWRFGIHLTYFPYLWSILSYYNNSNSVMSRYSTKSRIIIHAKLLRITLDNKSFFILQDNAIWIELLYIHLTPISFLWASFSTSIQVSFFSILQIYSSITDLYFKHWTASLKFIGSIIAKWQYSELSISLIYGNLAYNYVIGFFPLGPIFFCESEKYEKKMTNI